MASSAADFHHPYGYIVSQKPVRAPAISPALVDWLESVFARELRVPTDVNACSHRELDHNSGIAKVVDRIRTEQGRQNILHNP